MYITEDDVRSLCNKIGTNQISSDEVKRFITKAEARIDAVLATRYVLPLPSPTPPLIVSIASDFAASFIIDKYYADLVRSKEQTPLADVYFKRAESDLKAIVTKGLIDRYPGVITMNKPENVQTPCMKKTRKRSDMEEALTKW
jgi:phage gp36-like protein